MNGSNAAHLLGALFLTAGLPAQLQGRAVLSRLLLLFGMTIAHVPDLLAVTTR